MQSTGPIAHPADELAQTMDRIYRSGMTTTSGGNLSIRDENGNIWITPSRIDKGNLTREGIACISPDGSVKGPYAPSSELPFHRAIYAARPDVRAIVHAHPRGLQSFSIVRQVPETRISQAAYQLCGPGGLARYALPGSEGLGREIAQVFKEGHNCVVLENHAVVVGGRTMREAFDRFEMFEFTAMTILRAKGLGAIRLASDAAPGGGDETAPAMEEFEPSHCGEAEKQVRASIVAFLRRGLALKMMTQSSDAISVRVDEHSFVTTPRHLDHEQERAEDLILIANGKREKGKLPNRMLPIHQAIFARHPEIGAIVSASPLNAMALSITDDPCDTSIIPESYVFVGRVQRVPFPASDKDAGQLAERISLRNPAAILENTGAVVAGTDLLDAFGRLEVLEATVETIIDGRSLGTVAPISPGHIKELCEALSLQ